MKTSVKILTKSSNHGVRIDLYGEMKESCEREIASLASMFDISDFFMLLCDSMDPKYPEVDFCLKNNIDLLKHSDDLILAKPKSWQSVINLLLFLAFEIKRLGIDAFVRQENHNFNIIEKSTFFQFYLTSTAARLYWFMHLLNELKCFIIFQLEYPQMEVWANSNNKLIVEKISSFFSGGYNSQKIRS